MIQVIPQMRILVAVETADFRKGIDGLARVCKEVLQQDPFRGWMFVFRNHRATAVKVLVYDGQGFVLFHKKLETEDTHIFGFTEVERRAHNRHVGVAETGRMVGVSRKSGSRRSIMPRQGSRYVPPAPGGQGSRTAQPTLDTVNTGKATAGAANSGLRRGSSDRAASGKGGGR